MTAAQVLAQRFRPAGRSSRWDFASLFIGAHSISLLLGIQAVALVRVPVLNWTAIVAALGWICFFVPLTIVAGIRRLHDLGRSGWFLLLAFVPVVNVVMMLLLLFAKGKPVGATRWG